MGNVHSLLLFEMNVDCGVDRASHPSASQINKAASLRMHANGLSYRSVWFILMYVWITHSVRVKMWSAGVCSYRRFLES